MRFHHECADLVVDLGNELPDTVYLVSSSSTAVSLVPTFTRVNDGDNSCTLTTGYAVREYGTSAWNLITDTTPHDYTAFLASSGTFAIDVSSTTPATFNPALVFEIRITYSASTLIAIAATRSDVFLLTMKDQCIDNVIVCTGAVDFGYLIPNDAVTVLDVDSTVSTCTQTVDSVDSSGICSFTSTLEIHDDATDSWEQYDETNPALVAKYPWIKDSTFVAANRIMTVSTVDSVTYQSPITHNLRWRAFDARAGTSSYDEFDITIQYGCT